MVVTAWSVCGVDGGFSWSGAKMVVTVVESGGSVVWMWRGWCGVAAGVVARDWPDPAGCRRKIIERGKWRRG
nr:hypothetical protein [Tanacetum cinerariifolium]